MDVNALFPTQSCKMTFKQFDQNLFHMVKNGFNSYVDILPSSVTSSHQQTIVSVVPSTSNLNGKKVNTHFMIDFYSVIDEIMRLKVSLFSEAFN